MRIRFSSRRLQRCAQVEREAIRRWGPAVGRAYVQRVRTIERATSMQSLYAVRAMNLHPLTGDRRGQLAIRLTGRARLIVEPGGSDDEIVVVEVSDHYGD